MKRSWTNFVSFYALLATVLGASTAVAAQAPNPRSVVNSDVASQRIDGRSIVRGDGDNVNVLGRSAVRQKSGVAGRNVADVKVPSVARTASRQNTVVRSGTTQGASSVRSATVARAASDTGVLGSSRNSSNVSKYGLSRAAAQSRATAVFSDVSKIGGGYSTCRDAYATCMDQFCAAASDTYRRCYCSERFIDFRDTEDALDEAKVLLQKFEDNNLNAVDKTAAEVNAMYSASIGEAAIKNDTSAAQSILNEIGDLLSGKRKPNRQDSTLSMGVMSLDFSTEIGDVWGEGGGTSIFDSGTGVDLTTLEGSDLYNASNKQCLQMIADSCDNKATLNMASSAYSIMISQDCNAYERSLNSKREAVLNTVRQAEKILREARLEEYRAHNSQDVNDCLSKVKSAITNEVACGANYKRCLDYSGKYVRPDTGEVIYSPTLFQLSDQIILSGNADVSDILAANPNYDKFLESKKMFANTALDSCRDIADVVWKEFKRSALVEISQAQDDLIEEVKMTCVNTMAECYDTQSGALKDFDTTTAKAAGALSVYAAKSMCQEKVTACAALYSSGVGCSVDDKGKISNAETCGLAALLAFVDTVDNVRVAESCETALDAYVKDLCTPTTGEKGYPWRCRTLTMGNVNQLGGISQTSGANVIGNNFANMVAKFAVDNCSDPTIDAAKRTFDALPVQTKTQVQKFIDEVQEELSYQLREECLDLDGYWMIDKNETAYANAKPLSVFYSTFYAGKSADESMTFGKCAENSTRVSCLAYNSNAAKDGEDEEPLTVASYNLDRDECTFTDSWFEAQCKLMGNGYYENGICYVAEVSSK